MADTSDDAATSAEARRLFELVEPVAGVAFSSSVLEALGLPNVWDGYFATRAAALGADVPAEVVHALFYSFADGEAARHIPAVWERTTPQAALAARERACADVLRERLGALADGPEVTRAGDLLLKAGAGARTEGRALFAALRALPVPQSPLARLWHGATLLREYRGDGHNAVLLTAGIGGTESHVLRALADGQPAEQDGRLGHLPAGRVGDVVRGLQERGIVGDDGWLTPAGQALKQRIEDDTDRLAVPGYAALDRSELDQLIGDLTSLVAALDHP